MKRRKGFRQTLTHIIQLHDNVCTDDVLDRDALLRLRVKVSETCDKTVETTYSEHRGLSVERAFEERALLRDLRELVQRDKLKPATVLGSMISNINILRALSCLL